MPFPSFEDITDTEWDWILLVERTRGLTTKQIGEAVGCFYQMEKGPWQRFKEECAPYLRHVSRVRCRSVKYQVYKHLDASLTDGHPSLTDAVLADVFNVSEKTISQLRASWKQLVKEHEHWPQCRNCSRRGSKCNPLLENGLCLICNAREHGWPLNVWMKNGQYVALLRELGLMEDKVADYIGGNGDSSDCTEVRGAEEKRELVGAAA